METEPDVFFSAAQHERLQELFARRDTLNCDERQELEGLIDAELDATIARTQSLMLAPRYTPILTGRNSDYLPNNNDL